MPVGAAAVETGKAPPDLLIFNSFEVAEGQVPDAIPLIPAPQGEDRVVGSRDGREFVVPSLKTLLEGQASYGMDPPLDWEHESERGGWWSSTRAPAAAWIKELFEKPDGSTWGRVEWTAEGAAAVRSRSYRYISPAFQIAFQQTVIDGVPTIDFDKPPVVVRLTSAALTNRPALHMPSLNQNQSGAAAPPPSPKPTRKHRMDLATLAALLGLSASATEADVTRAIKSADSKLDVFGLKLSSTVEDAAAAKKQLAEVDLDAYVPAKLHAAEVQARKAAEESLSALKKSAHEAEVEGWLQANLERGKILPTQLDTFRAMALGGEQQFAHAKQLVEAAPERLGDPPAAAPAPGKATAGSSAKASAAGVPEHVASIAHKFGRDPKEFYEQYRKDAAQYQMA